MSWRSGRVEHRRVRARAQGQEPEAVVDEGDDGECPGHAEAERYGVRHLALGRDHDVDRDVVVAEQVAEAALEIVLLADAGDLGGDVEERVRHLARHHVDLVAVA